MIAAGWALFALGAAHIIFGAVRFRSELADAWAAGFIGRFAAPESRRTAFWFLMSGPPMMALGQLAVHAADRSDRWQLGVIGWYLLAATGVGVAAFPKSPLWAPFLLAPVFIAAGLGIS